MSKLIQYRYRVLVVVVLLLVVGAATFGFANTNTMPAAYFAGEGNSTVSGYTVTALKFNLNASNPLEFSTLAFHLNGPASTVYVSLDGATTWISCTPTVTAGETGVSCDLTGVAVGPVTSLYISAVQ
jgi:hypothetical protein